MDIDSEELRALVEQGEGKGLEFKAGLQRDEKIARTLVAFANTRGGILLVGIGDRGEILGAPHPRETVEKLREIAANLVEPPLSIELSIVPLSSKKIVCCSIPLSNARPHAVIRAEGGNEIVVRAGSSNRVATGAVLKALRAPRAKPNLDPLERRVLEWVESRTRGGASPQSDATITRFADACNIGKQRAKRAFVGLERAGLLVGHGVGARRTYSRT